MLAALLKFEFCQLLRTPFLQNTSKPLPLKKNSAVQRATFCSYEHGMKMRTLPLKRESVFRKARREKKTAKKYFRLLFKIVTFPIS